MSLYSLLLVILECKTCGFSSSLSGVLWPSTQALIKGKRVHRSKVGKRVPIGENFAKGILWSKDGKGYLKVQIWQRSTVDKGYLIVQRWKKLSKSRRLAKGT